MMIGQKVCQSGPQSIAAAITNSGWALARTATRESKRFTSGCLLTALVFSLSLPSMVAAADFAARCQGSGVVRCFTFDSQAEVQPHLFPTWDNVYRGQVDTNVKASGAGSLRFEIPSNSPANSSGSFWLNFADNLSTQFGEGQEFYVQWRQRFSPEMLRAFKTTDGGLSGWKQVIVGEGDQPGLPTVYSCTELELVFQQDVRYMGPGFYHSCGRFIDLEFYDGTQIRMQHQGPPYCYYPNDPQKGCVRYAANEWMTFQMRVQIGKWNTPSSRIQSWVARENQSSIMIYDSINSHPSGFTLYNNPGSGSGTNPGAKYGKIWLLPYHTRKDPTETHPTAYTWYDELIISRSEIPDPTSSGDSIPPAPPSNLSVN